MPWDDIWSSVVIIGLSIIFGIGAHRNGPRVDRTFMYLLLANLGISLAGLYGEGGYAPGGWWFAPYALLLTVVPFFTTLGVLATFAAPKNVKCMRCSYVGYPWESEDSPTPTEPSERREFEKLHWKGVTRRREIGEGSVE